MSQHEPSRSLLFLAGSLTPAKPTVSLVEACGAEILELVAMPLRWFRLAFPCNVKESAAELNNPVKLPPESEGALLSGCSGCVGSALRVKDTPNLNCASVASITVKSQSHVGFKCASKYNCKYEEQKEKKKKKHI